MAANRRVGRTKRPLPVRLMASSENRACGIQARARKVRFSGSSRAGNSNPTAIVTRKINAVGG